jgi:hypothetical protein
VLSGGEPIDDPLSAELVAETWLYHLRRHDYSAWLREAIKDSAIAVAVALVENSW